MELDRLRDVRLGGIGKIFHKIILLLTYPVRHFFKFLAFLFVGIVILASIPMMKGVSYRHIPDWYLMRYNKIKETESPQINASTQTIEHRQEPKQFKEVAAPKIIRKKPEAVVEPAGNRRAFKRAEAPFRRIEIKEQPAPSQPATKKTVNQLEVAPKPISPYYRVDKSLPLEYVENPQEIQGKAIIFSANDLAVGETYLYLYGIYTYPEKYDLEKAHLYLEELTRGKQLTCKIVAYTLQNIATGVCFLDGRSINQNLVDAGFADNVAL